MADYEKGRKQVQDTNIEAQALKETFREVGRTVTKAIEDALNASKSLKEHVDDLGDTYSKDIAGGIAKMTQGFQSHVALQSKILAGEDVRKEIQGKLNNIKAAELVLDRRIAAAKGDVKKKLEEQKEELANSLGIEKDQLEEMLNQNKATREKVGLFGELGNQLGNNIDKLDKTGTLSNLLKGNFKEVATFSNMSSVGLGLFVGFLIDGVAKMSKLTTEFNKSLGVSDSQAANLKDRMSSIAFEMNNVSINSLDTQKAFMNLNQQFGTASTVIRKDIVGEMAKLGKLTNMSAESQGRFASFAMRSGKNATEITKESRRQVMNAEAEFGVRLDINKVLDEAGKITGVIAANLGYNIEAIAGAVATAKQFGMTLEGLANISNKLLDFQSSISAELQAELFTGKQLNLERARLAALTGDYKTLAEEIKFAAGSELEFAQMNVLAKEKLANALGMSADQMADMLYAQANLAELAQEARDLGDDETADMLEKRNLQQQFNDLVEKVQMTFVDLAAGPLGDIANLLVSIMQNAELLYGIMGLIAAFKLAGLIGSMITLWGTLAGAGITAAGLASALTLGLGAVAIAAGITYIAGSLATETDKATKIPQAAEGGSVEGSGLAVVHEGEEIVPAEIVKDKNQNGMTKLNPQTKIFQDESLYLLDKIRLATTFASTKSIVAMMAYDGFAAGKQNKNYNTKFK